MIHIKHVVTNDTSHMSCGHTDEFCFLRLNGADSLLQKTVKEVKVVGERGEGELLSLFL